LIDHPHVWLFSPRRSRAVNAAGSPLKGQLGLPIVPIDDFERHPAFEHFRLEIRSVLLPIGRLSNAEPGLFAEANKFIVGLEGAADTLVHHSKAIVCKSLIVHRATLAKKLTLAHNLRG